MSTVLCRVCVNPFQQAEMTMIFDEANIPLSLAIVLSEIGGIEIPVEDEGLPKFCCQGCSSRLEDASDLRKLCQESDRKLRKMMKSVVKDEIDDVGGLLEQTMEEPVESRELRKRATTTCIKTEELVLETECPSPMPSDDDRVSDLEESEDDAKDPDFVEEKPKQKEPKKAAPKKKSANDDPDFVEAKVKVTRGKYKKKLSSEGKKPRKKATFQCASCGVIVKSRAHLKEHENTHFPLQNLQCHLCPRRYSFVSSLRHHLNTHDPNHVYKCDQCGKVLKTESGYRSHMDSHSAEPAFKCSLCPKAYFRQSTLYGHVQREHYKRKRFKCDLCPKEFYSMHRTKEHRAAVHEGLKPNVCPHCSKGYESVNYLAQHIAERHPEHVENLSQCAFCGKGYTTNSHYRKHVTKQHPDRMAEFEVLIKGESMPRGPKKGRPSNALPN